MFPAFCAMCLLRLRRLLFTRQRAQIGSHGDISFVVHAPQHHRAFWHFPLMRDKARKKKARARKPTTANRAAVNWICVSGYNREACSVEMGAVSHVFADLSWYRGLCAKKPRVENRQWGESDRRSTQEETRRGRAGAMHAVVAARTFWLCGTAKCPSEFATDGVCGDS